MYAMCTGFNFVLQLDPPLRRRNKTEAYIVVQFGEEDPIPDAELNTDGEGIAERLGDLTTTYEDKETGETRNAPAHILLGKILTKLAKKKVVAPDTFNTTYEENCVGCHAEGQQGYLYPLERALIYVHKPTIHIRYDDIISVEMLRANQYSAVQVSDAMVTDSSVWTEILDIEWGGSANIPLVVCMLSLFLQQPPDACCFRHAYANVAFL